MGGLVTINAGRRQPRMSRDTRRAVLYRCQQLRLRIAEHKSTAGHEEAAALERRIQGTVVLELVVRTDGRPTDIRVIRSLEAGLDLQAIIVAREWRFEPGRLGGRPVDVQVVLMIDFWIR